MSSDHALGALSASALAPHYRRFRVTERVLLTGHSHQAWPDVAREGQLAAWDDAAEHVDDKWGRAFERAERVREGFRARLGGPEGDITLGANTHELLVRLLSALPLRQRPRIVTTDGEFHTVRRQLDRLGEEGAELVRVPSLPAETVGERLLAAIDSRTALVIVSAVFFDSGRIAGGLDALAAGAAARGVALLVDTYHALSALPFDTRALGLESAFLVGGGYKYCQLGEGNCFLRTPPNCDLRPVVTGWFAAFEHLGDRAVPGRPVPYGSGPGARFAGATYDPTSHYRAARVFEFHDAQGLTPDRLRALSLRQLDRLVGALEAHRETTPSPWFPEVPTPETLRGGGAFLVLETPRAGELVRALHRDGVYADHRGDKLRLGPAPYVTVDQLDHAADVLSRAIRTLS
ncbi:MAG: kynureninase [Myxococcales bacterium]|nr:kynureninase [Myxococcales bacterium]